jgi:hypothetical protein
MEPLCGATAWFISSAIENIYEPTSVAFPNWIVATVVAGNALPSAIAARIVTLPPGGGARGAVYVPLEAILPQPPDNLLVQLTLQTGETLFDCTVAVKACCAPPLTIAPVGEITSGGGVMMTLAEEVRLVSAFATAVIVTELGVGTAVGAVYRPFVSIVPTVELPPETPFTCHVTAVFVENVTAAVNCCVCAAATKTLEGLTETGIAIVTLALAVLLASAAAVAVIVTVAEAGTEAGAVYSPALVIVP